MHLQGCAFVRACHAEPESKMSGIANQNAEKSANRKPANNHEARSTYIQYPISCIYPVYRLGVALTVNRCYKPQAPLIGLLLTLSGHEFDTTPQCTGGATVCDSERPCSCIDWPQQTVQELMHDDLDTLQYEARQNLQVQEHAACWEVGHMHSHRSQETLDSVPEL